MRLRRFFADGKSTKAWTTTRRTSSDVSESIVRSRSTPRDREGQQSASTLL